jgi:hypothetical protein
VGRDIERLDAEAISDQEQLVRFGIECRKRKEAMAAVGCAGRTPTAQRVEHRLRVAAAPEGDPRQLPTQLSMVEDLSVVSERPSTGRIRHRLMPGGARIDDCETRVDEADVALHLDAGVIRSPVV